IRSRDASGNWSAVSTPVMRQGPDPFGDHSGVQLVVGRNPSTPPVPLLWQTGPTAPGGSLRILDISGRLVRSLSVGSAVNGIAYWDGRDADGRRLPAGVYLVSLSSDRNRE